MNSRRRIGSLVPLLFILLFAEGLSARHWIRVVNRYGGFVGVRVGDRGPWTRLGRVLRPDRGQLKTIGPREFTAADWAASGAVAATAVNAIHCKVAEGEPHSVVFSLMPQRYAQGDPQSYMDPPSTILLDIAPARGIFAVPWAPYVGSRLFLGDARRNRRQPWPPGHGPALGEEIWIEVVEPAPELRRLDFENRFDGRVTASFSDGASRIVARVLRPICGTGRFGGTTWTGTGRVRANHPGVLCISTGPVGQVGGIQLIPARHASDPELDYVRTVPVWMVLGPPSPDSPPLEGAWPLFSGALRPGEGRLYLRRKEGPWQPSEDMVGKRCGALLDCTALRLDLPALP